MYGKKNRASCQKKTGCSVLFLEQYLAKIHKTSKKMRVLGGNNKQNA